MSDINKLIQELNENPEKINDLSDEDLKEIQKKIIPYGTVLSPEDQNIYAIAYTNLREDYITKLTMTSMVGFMFRQAREFLLSPHKDADAKENALSRDIIMLFLNNLFRFDPDKHVQECAKPPQNKNEIDELVELMKCEKLDEFNFLNIDEIEKVAGSTSIPNDVFAWYRMYKKDNYERLRWATMALFKVLPDLELMIQPVGVFANHDDYKDFENLHKDTVQFSITALNGGHWNLLGDFNKNKEKVAFLNKHTEVLSRILEQHKKDEAIGEELLKKRIQERKKENIRRDGPDSEHLDGHLADLPVDVGGSKRATTKEERETLVNTVKTDKTNDSIAEEANSVFADRTTTKTILRNDNVVNNYNDDHNPPEEAISVNVFTTDKKKGLQKGHFFTQAYDPEEEEAMAKDRLENLKKIEKEEIKKKHNRKRKGPLKPPPMKVSNKIETQ